MAGNPLIAQGSLNRLRGSLIVVDHPELNVTASFLGKTGIGLGLEGESTLFLPTMTGAVTSPEPYMMVALTVALLKTQNLANLYKLRMETDARIGDITVTPDSSTLAYYPITNCAIQSVREMSFSGENADWVCTLKGYYLISNGLWALI